MVEVDDLKIVRKKKPGEDIEIGDIIDLSSFKNDTRDKVFNLMKEKPDRTEFGKKENSEEVFYPENGDLKGVLPERSLSTKYDKYGEPILVGNPKRNRYKKEK